MEGGLFIKCECLRVSVRVCVCARMCVCRRARDVGERGCACACACEEAERRRPPIGWMRQDEMHAYGDDDG